MKSSILSKSSISGGKEERRRWRKVGLENEGGGGREGWMKRGEEKEVEEGRFVE